MVLLSDDISWVSSLKTMLLPNKALSVLALNGNGNELPPHGNNPLMLKGNTAFIAISYYSVVQTMLIGTPGLGLYTYTLSVQG